MKRVLALLLSGMLLFTSVGTAAAQAPMAGMPRGTRANLAPAPIEPPAGDETQEIAQFIVSLTAQEVEAARPAGPQSRAATGDYFGESLESEFELDLYFAIKDYLTDVVSGEATSNYLRTDVSGEGLELEMFSEYAWNVYDALIKDHADKLYWMDKTGYTSFGRMNNTDKVIVLFPIIKEYQGDKAGDIPTPDDPVPYYWILNNSDRLAEAQAVVDKILDSGKGMNDFEQIKMFNQMICTLTDYDWDATEPGSPYDDSFQWVSVFLGEPVVCEGYAKAFKYLCDSADIGCFLVEGTAGTGEDIGNHMWNYVELEEKWYLVDCTNNDVDSGSYTEAFLAIGSENKSYKEIAYDPTRLIGVDEGGNSVDIKPLNPANDLLEKADYTPSADKYTIRVQGGEADMTQAAAGAIVTVTATGTRTFSHWSSNSSKVEFLDSNARETRFIMPGENVVITANYSDSGYVGGGSGSANDDTPARTPAAPVEKAYTQQELQDKTADAVNRAIEKATAAGSKSGNATIILENPKNLTPELLKAIVDKAAQLSAEKGVTITPMVAIDQVVDGKIVSRIYIDPAKFPLTGEIVLDVTLGDAAVTTHFANYFTNTIKVVTLTPAGTLPAPLTLAVKMDLTGLDEKNLIFYTYDPATNSYSRIEKPNYRVDENGYVYLTSPTGGPILVTDKVMTAK